MEFVKRSLEGLYDVHYKPMVDNRGSLTRVFNADLFEPVGGRAYWVQHLFSYTERRNTMRGLYIQRAPATEAKLIIPLIGEAYWMAVDLRKDSPTFGKWEGTYLSPERNQGLYISHGFAHGHLSITDKVTLSLLADNRHSDELGLGIRWDDPELAIEWPKVDGPWTISDAHAAYPSFKVFRETVGGI